MRVPKRAVTLSMAILAAVSMFAAAGVVNAGAAHAATGPQPISDSQLNASTIAIGGAEVLPTTRTVAHWHGQTLDPHTGVTYGYNMVGANPNGCSGSVCDVTIEADITPIIVNVAGFAGYTFDGTSVVNATLASPQFSTNDYGTTPAATAAGSFPVAPAFIKGPGGTLSQGDAGNLLQLEDATMRAQFNQTGSSTYHLRLQPNVLPPVTINVPQEHGTLIVSGRGVVAADVDIKWWSSQIKNLETQADPTHLPIYLTNQVMLYQGTPGNCCVIGYHGTIPVGLGAGSGNSNGNAVVQTFAWASYVQPGFYSRANGGTDWALQDIHALSHEIAEWADDPFVNNGVEPWLTPTAPQYGCTGVLETGDPVVGIGFALGTNSFEQGPNPNGSQSADGSYHPEDEVFLPWYMRTTPNMVSEATQSPSTNVGRFTLMGTLNPFPGFRQPATGC
jgi:hypothetical protein